MKKLSRNYYEVHLTFVSNDVERLKYAIETVGWKFSKIDGDPVLGEGVKCYATKHYAGNKPQSFVASELDKVVREITAILTVLPNTNIVRKKIESVLYDEVVK